MGEVCWVYIKGQEAAFDEAYQISAYQSLHNLADCLFALLCRNCISRPWTRICGLSSHCIGAGFLRYGAYSKMNTGAEETERSEEALNNNLATVIEGEELGDVISSFAGLASDPNSPSAESLASVANALNRIAESIDQIALSQPECPSVHKGWGNRLGLNITEDIANSLSRIANSLDAIHEIVSGRLERRLDRKIKAARFVVGILIVLLILSFARVLMGFLGK